MVCSANQIARLTTTPTTAAVIVESAALTALLSRRTSTNGAPRKIQRKHGMKVTQVASNPPSVPASIGESAPGRHEAHELQDHDQRPRRRPRHPKPIEHLARFEPAVVLDCLLGDIREHRVGAAEGHHGHLAEEDGDLAEDVSAPQSEERRNHGKKPKREPYTRGT